jgi:hypothetical protein
MVKKDWKLKGQISWREAVSKCSRELVLEPF